MMAVVGIINAHVCTAWGYILLAPMHRCAGVPVLLPKRSEEIEHLYYCIYRIKMRLITILPMRNACLHKKNIHKKDTATLNSLDWLTDSPALFNYR